MNQNTASRNEKPDHELWAQYLEECAGWLDQQGTPAASLAADLTREAAGDARLHGLANATEHRAWLAETAQEALNWLEGGWDPSDTWEADDRTGALTGHDDPDDADLN